MKNNSTFDKLENDFLLEQQLKQMVTIQILITYNEKKLTYHSNGMVSTISEVLLKKSSRFFVKKLIPYKSHC